MGDILMKYLFDKQSYTVSGLSPEARRERIFYTVLQLGLFLLAAFSLWEFLYELCNIVGSIVEACPPRALVQLIRMVPMILTAFTYVYLNVWCFRAYRAVSPESRAETWKGNGIATIVLGAVIALYVVIGVITGEYDRFVEGFLSPLFPLDLCIGGVLLMVYGAVSVVYGRRLTEKPSVLSCRTKRAPAFLRPINGIFYVLSFCVALCSFAACFYGTYVMDWSHGAILFNVMLWLNYFTAFLMALVYRFVWVELKDECKAKAEVQLGLIFLIVNIVLFAVYLVTVQIWNEAPNQNAYAIIPIDFTACFNAFAPIMALNNLVGPLAALIKGLLSRN